MTDIYIILEWGLIFSLLVLSAIAAMRVGIFCLVVETIFLNAAIYFTLALNIWELYSIGLLVGISAGLITTFLFYFLVVIFDLEEIVTGIALNIFSIGFSNVMLYKIFSQRTISIPIEIHINTELVIIIALVIAISTKVLLDKSILRIRFKAIETSSESAIISNISVLKNNFIAILLTGFTATVAGIYLAHNQGFIGLTLWTQGLGFLALGVAFAARGSIGIGIFAAIILAIGRYLSLSPNLPEWLTIPDIFLKAAPYILLVLFIILVGLWERRILVRGAE